MRHQEKVAGRRRALPPGPAVEDYVFLEGPADLDAGDTPVREVTLSGLFTAPDRPLIVYHLMYGKKQTEPCPMCTLWTDGFNGIVHHITLPHSRLRSSGGTPIADFVIAAAADPPSLRQHGRNRGWHRLRLLSCGDSTFKYDMGSEGEDGEQDSTVSVFTRDGDGTVRHFYSAHPRMADTVGERGIDLLAPVWHLLDLTPRVVLALLSCCQRCTAGVGPVGLHVALCCVG
jgi:predicted dithiol-disulfide oxidoreductase (DUF899 family)